ncbi:3-methyl-2-oxobutanoate dehydrogenase subunit VorB [Desulfopila aestuarii]|uniref:2-oxoglutarate ferredoxin oxidoreductase subunit alpha n=1 Tax=Desulfopila aestuarii DSM 18488 TaxID=1121416 RepID=A0A1M7Y5B4_9BACT|nr:3-methyl-2-oxobutanoate dehydrogenase subunit VorB [Desulfopila aestuarii]SHO47545.1 2-oxoglutarate ferredoxin oxidoreductase subunit alpha [Desulfopila aestuarii DSM 18488]
MTMTLMKGNEALALAAIRGGCTHFFGYPITPQNEIPEFLARELPKIGGVFIQAESEIGAVNMLYGAAAVGCRVMTSSSSPGLALMQEGISLLAAAEMPCVIVNVMRGGPGIGGIQPSQADYFQMTRGGGNGDYRVPALAPATVQESVSMMVQAFEMADCYRTPVFIVSDGMLGQMMEPVEFDNIELKEPPEKEWKLTGHGNVRKPKTIKTLMLDPARLEARNFELQEKFQKIAAAECSWEEYLIDDAVLVFTAYGSTARIARNAVDQLREEGFAAGLIRPRTLWPFPDKPFQQLASRCQTVLCVEMSCGQMVDDVRLAVNGKLPVAFYGRCGGMIPSPEELVAKAKNIMKGGRQ